MAEKRIGVAISATDSSAALAAIEDLEKRGYPAAWMTSGSASGGDSLSVFAAAASRTRNIMLGTAITQIFPRHPIAVAQHQSYYRTERQRSQDPIPRICPRRCH